MFGASFIPRTQTFQGTNFGSILTLSPLLGLICVPIMAVIAVFYFVTIVGITHLIARAVGGTGTYSQLLYTSAAISAPAWIINGFLGLIPVVPYLTIPLGIYALVLDVMAVKAVHQFGWGQALLSSFGIWVLLLIFVAAITIGILGRASRP